MTHYIGIIMEGKRGFVAMVGTEINGGDPDSNFFHVVGQQPPQPTAEAAAAFIIEDNGITEKLLTPLKALDVATLGLMWMDQIRKLQK